jgi:hypothetical protein
VNESFAELALVVFPFDHWGNSSRLVVEEFVSLDFVSLGPHWSEFRRSYTNSRPLIAPVARLKPHFCDEK